MVKRNFFLIIILLAALLVRLVGTNPGFPPYHPDEAMSHSSAVEMIVRGDLDPQRYDYPAAIPLLHYFFFRTFFLPLALLKAFFPHPRVFLTALKIGPRFLNEFRVLIFGAREVQALFWSRYLHAFLGVGAVFLTYLLGNKLFNKTTGLLAAFFLAFNYRHVLSSHFALSDIPNSFFSLLAVYSCLLLLKKNNGWHYLLAGFSCGLFLSSKYQFFPILTFFLAHLIWVWRKKSLKEFFNKNFIFAALLIPVVFILINPYLFLHLKEALAQINLVSLRYGMGVRHFNFYPLFYLYHWGIGRWSSLAIIGGLLLSVILKPLETFFLLSFIIPFLFVFLYYSSGGTYVRNFITVIPFLLIFAGFLFSQLFRWLKRFGFLVLILLFLVNFLPIKNSLVLSYSYIQAWNPDRLSAWLGKNLPSQVQVRSHSIVNFPQEAEKGIKREAWQTLGETSMAEFREVGDQFAVMNLDFYHVLLYYWFGLPIKEMIKYDGVPFEFLANNFSGLALEEWLDYTVVEFFKPWQSHDFNYLVLKIPAFLQNRGREVASFNFNSDDEDWWPKGLFGQKTEGFIWNENEGRLRRGSLEIGEKAKGFSTAHFASTPIGIKPGQYYTFSAWLKNSQVVPSNQRDGFLRMDFYQDRADAQIGKNRLRIALSSRVFNTSDWIKKEASAIAPAGANYVVLSFQRENLSSGMATWLDEAALFESETLPQETFPELPYIKPTIPKEVLYPNSII